MYKKALTFVTNNPQSELSEADLRKETRQPVAAIANSKSRGASYAAREDSKGPSDKSLKCFRCKKSGHIARYCCAEACRNCGMIGHAAETCRRPAAGRGRGRGGVAYKQKQNKTTKKTHQTIVSNNQDKGEEEDSVRKEDVTDIIGAVHADKENYGGQVAVNVRVKKADGTYVPVAALLDSGACVSLITYDFMKELGFPGNIQNHREAQDISIASVQGNSIATEGSQMLILKFGRKSSQQELIVT